MKSLRIIINLILKIIKRWIQITNQTNKNNKSNKKALKSELTSSEIPGPLSKKTEMRFAVSFFLKTSSCSHPPSFALVLSKTSSTFTSPFPLRMSLSKYWAQLTKLSLPLKTRSSSHPCSKCSLRPLQPTEYSQRFIRNSTNP